MSEFDIHEYPAEDEAEPEDASPDTGTVYDEEGEAQVTPQDLESDEDEE